MRIRGLEIVKLRFFSSVSLVLAVLSFSSSLNAITLAELAYKANPWNEKCEQFDPSKNASSELFNDCVKSNSKDDRLQRLSSDFGDVSENAYLASLAEQRAKALSCTDGEINGLLKDPAKLSEFTEDVSNKLTLLGYLNVKMESLRGSVGSDKAATAEYKKSKLAQEAILAALPFSEIPSMKLMYNHISSQSDLFKAEGVEPFFEKYIKDNIQGALKKAQKKVTTDLRALKDGHKSLGVSLSDDLRKSLAQDDALIEKFQQENPSLSASTKPVACRVDAKYGTGARYVQETLIIGGTIAVGGIAGAAVKMSGGALASAVASGNLSSKAATLIRLGAIGAGATATASASMYDICLSVHPLTEVGETCGGSGLQTLPQTNCFMSAVLEGTGALAFGLNGAKKALSYFETKATARVEAQGAKAVSSADGQALEKAALVKAEARAARQAEAAQQKERLLKLADEQAGIPYKEPTTVKTNFIGGSYGGKPPQYVAGYKKDVALTYDVAMAEKSGLSVSEVTALRKNFGDEIPETGELGVYRLGDKVALDAESNLVGAYSRFSKRLDSGEPLTAQDLIDVRTQSHSLRAVTKKNGETELVSLPMEFKGKFSTTLDSEISPYVQERLKHYNIDFKISEGKTKIMYPEGSREVGLNKLTDDLNTMIARGDPAERVSAFAVQELLILHPFKDGNGRTARLVGQALMKKLKGVDVVFPGNFHKEMEYDVDTLTRSIMPFDPNKRERDMQSAAEMLYTYHNKKLPEYVDKKKLVSNAPREDVPFPKEFKAMDGVSVKYDSLPDNVRRYSDSVFYGKPAGKDLESAEQAAETMMKFGRGSREANPSLDIAAHVDNTRIEPGKKVSGFFPTSKDFTGGASFAKMKGSKGQYGVSYEIDARGAEVLDITELNTLRNNRGSWTSEGEVLFGPRVNPARIKSAVIFGPDGKVVKILKNPLYVPQK
ncbi:Fic/DOC family protein [compost metagenome]